MMRPGAVLFEDPHVFITVCSTAGQAKFGKHIISLDRRLELNWTNFQDFRNGDIIGVFDFDVNKDLREKDKGKSIVELAKESAAVTGQRGCYKTSVRYERRPLCAKDRSLGYWVAYLRFQTGSWVVVKSNFLKVRPLWMRELKNIIGDIPLHSLMIPGSHDAGSWMEYDHGTCENIYVRYYICQEDSIYDQLIHGIRYLDVRVAFYPETEERFWVNHDKYRVHPLLTLLTDVRRFVEETKEIIFLDFHSFPIGFSGPEIHEELIKFVMSQIGKHLVPTSYPTSVTTNMLWKANKNIIWTYAEDSFASQDDNKCLWPYLLHAWGNKRKPEHLEKYMDEAIQKHGGQGIFYSLMAELTPKPIDYISKPRFGLRGFAELVNLPLTYWFQSKEWYSKCNIVSTDFHLGNNIIEMAIDVNTHKVLPSLC
ncbi:PI-PLC X domain-containing protein 1 [Folsomia candida]|uniref:PI-PLC X domain-containing protein 1 n=1 Tax=Folsomia candida TaxID=158441 RepID=A0A226EQ90_FOLCA|nr:PI-PLC X domain-containing protein 1 [Folsomia candida]OXA59358.1 PI-PLC X domain-containing protein 1 [Folsomia candida]